MVYNDRMSTKVFFSYSVNHFGFYKSRPEVIKLFPCSTQLSTKDILFINVKMPTIVGILTLFSRMNS